MDPRWARLKKRLILRKGGGEYKRDGEEAGSRKRLIENCILNLL
jgi:hypothetical protein